MSIEIQFQNGEFHPASVEQLRLLRGILTIDIIASLCNDISMLTKRINFKVDDEMYEWVKKTAHTNDASMAQVIRWALDEVTKRNHPQKEK